jgi:hypothetical protein
VMDMWKPFRLATGTHASHAAILFNNGIWARPWTRFARANVAQGEPHARWLPSFIAMA